MASWSENRGYTLILTHPKGPDRYARVALVHKRTLFGQAYNVREARAEDATRSRREPEALGLGRMLSWRWLGEREAEELLSARLRTLETLGYGVLDGEAAETRGPWDWLRDLVQRQLQRADADANTGSEADMGRESDPNRDSNQETSAVDSLRESLERLGLEPEAILDGLATILELDVEELRAPTAAVVAKLEPELLAMLLPVWVEHESTELREVGQRWLALPTVLYELETPTLERWARSEGRLAAALAPTLEGEGLALLGPEALGRLAHTAKDARIKALASTWQARTRAS